MTAVPTSLLAVAERVEDRLRALLDTELARWADVAPALAAPLGSLAELVFSGGKRLRPAFCHWGFVGAGGDPDDDRVTAAGAAFELLHAFALFHDDVMDGSDTRRGARTTHLAFADQHAATSWMGESRRFGEGVAILVGDLAFVYADQLLEAAPPAVWRLWNELRIELNVGQYLDLLGTAQGERHRGHTERIGRYKSGKYTVERPLHVGAAWAAPERIESMLAPLSAYGLPLGDAFQLGDSSALESVQFGFYERKLRWRVVAAVSRTAGVHTSTILLDGQPADIALLPGELPVLARITIVDAATGKPL